MRRRFSTHRQPFGTVVLGAALVGSVLWATACASTAVGPISAGLDGATVVGPPPTSPSPLPYDPPRDETTAKKVFAHYFPPYPISLDNVEASRDYYATHYLDPEGEGGRYRDVGGFLRDRPVPREPRPGAEWAQEDLEEEVRQAISAGLDGFTVDILVPPDQGGLAVASRPAALLTAAEAVDVDFSIMLMPDMSGPLAQLAPEELADQLVGLARMPSAFRLDDGSLVVSPFRGEAKDPEWWSVFIDVMREKYQERVALVPVFVDSAVDLSSYAPVSYGLSAWGARNPAFNPDSDTGPQSPLGQAREARRLGKLWMAPVAVQDVRPSQQIFDEAGNSENLRRMWQNAISADSDWVQLTTWNDYSESTSFAPSVRHGWSFLDVSGYWLWWFKLGTPPPVVRDTLYLIHRTQFAEAATSTAEPSRMTLRPNSTPATDVVEALVFATAPGHVTVRTGAGDTVCEVAAGVSVCDAPLALGAISADLTRDGDSVASTTSPFPVVDVPEVTTLDYVAVSSRR